MPIIGDHLRRGSLQRPIQHLRHVDHVRFGIIGYLMRKLKFPAAPGSILALSSDPWSNGRSAQSLTISHGDISIFFTRPISAVLIGIALISLCARCCGA